ncbi:MAG TPA: hypothetical protein VN845_03055 [Solirubrobacteraceae bacterium]|nr:hypothetical protein [Solirubrobacteraceae bacterium]
MAARAIVTSHPVVACDVCGRSLLRGESPDVFLAGGQRRTVCELCVPRAAAEGWLREADNHAASARPARGRRAGSLFGRLRQLREPAESPARGETYPAPGVAAGTTSANPPQEGLYEFLEGGSIERAEPYEQDLYIDSAPAGESVGGVWSEEPTGFGESRHAVGGEQPESGHEELVESWSSAAGDSDHTAVTSGDLKVARALEVFNAGEAPRRVAGVARSLGAPSVTARAVAESGSTVAIVVAWELCWYRYEVDLGDEAMGSRLVAQGMELDELPEEDRLGNASADERGELAPLVGIG